MFFRLKKVGFAKSRHNDDITEDDERESEDDTRKQTNSPNSDRELCLLHPPQFVITDTEGHLTQSCDCGGDSSNMSSRRPSAIIAALRRPSQVTKS